MKKEHKPVALKNAPLEYAPANELGMVLERNPATAKTLKNLRPDRL